MKLGNTLYGEISGYRYDMSSEVTDILSDIRYKRNMYCIMFMLKKEEDGTYTVIANNWSTLSYYNISSLFRYIGIRIKEICIEVGRRNRHRRYITSDDYERFILSLRLRGLEVCND